ncbi:hypothetical protein [Chitinophaga pinensis]|uniref:hypothetical protein n=1 Tax=Chitinophaga pinensis TaxID=79329 RepID=UPI0021BD0D5B|nr:hypothetical protein [Chitinophaga pinensis]
MENSNNNKLVLVTGGSGFIASYCMIALLRAGFKVRASLRALSKADEVKGMLRQGGIQSLMRCLLLLLICRTSNPGMQP